MSFSSQKFLTSAISPDNRVLICLSWALSLDIIVLRFRLLCDAVAAATDYSEWEDVALVLLLLGVVYRGDDVV